jgi:membrane protease YdiL (CAAX protease family)
MEGEPTWYPPPQDDNEMHRPEPSGIRRIILGKDGLRAGWSFGLWLLFFWLLSIPLNTILHHVITKGSGKPGGPPMPEWFTLSNSAIAFLMVGIAGYLVSLIEKRPFSQYGINSLRGRAGQFGVGLLVGFGMLSLLVAILWRGGLLAFHGVRLHGADTTLLWAAIFGVSFLFTGLFEEFAFRGFPQFTLTRGIVGMLDAMGIQERRRAIAFWIAAVLLAVLFGAVHSTNPGEGRLGLITAGLIGLTFAYSLWRTGSLWWAIGFHAAWDWGESFFYGTADSGVVSVHRLLDTQPQGNPFYSGGTIGPEGSIWVFAIITLIALIIALTLKARPGSPAAEYAAEP